MDSPAARVLADMARRRSPMRPTALRVQWSQEAEDARPSAASLEGGRASMEAHSNSQGIGNNLAESGADGNNFPPMMWRSSSDPIGSPSGAESELKASRHHSLISPAGHPTSVLARSKAGMGQPTLLAALRTRRASLRAPRLGGGLMHSAPLQRQLHAARVAESWKGDMSRLLPQRKPSEDYSPHGASTPASPDLDREDIRRRSVEDAERNSASR